LVAEQIQIQIHGEKTNISIAPPLLVAAQTIFLFVILRTKQQKSRTFAILGVCVVRMGRMRTVM
jgi:hypothetical protein